MSQHFKDIDIIVGICFEFAIPLETFLDSDETEPLPLRLLNENYSLVLEDSFIQLSNYMLYGILLENELNIHSLNLILEAVDSHGTKAYDSLTIHVHQPITLPTHLITLVLDYNYSMFTQQWGYHTRLVDLLTNINSVINDSEDNSIRVVSVSSGSVVLKWFDISIPTDRCALADIDHTYQLLTNISAISLHGYYGSTALYQVKSVNVDFMLWCAGKTLPSLLRADTTSDDGISIGLLVTAIIVPLCVLLLFIILVYCCRKQSQPRKDPLQRQQKLLYTNNRLALVMIADRGSLDKPATTAPDESLSLVCVKPPSYKWSIVNPAYEHDTDDSAGSTDVEQVGQVQCEEVKVISDDLSIDGVDIITPPLGPDVIPPPPTYRLPPTYKN